jgi:hypothetical protein
MWTGFFMEQKEFLDGPVLHYDPDPVTNTITCQRILTSYLSRLSRVKGFIFYIKPTSLTWLNHREISLKTEKIL